MKVPDFPNLQALGAPPDADMAPEPARPGRGEGAGDAKAWHPRSLGLGLLAGVLAAGAAIILLGGQWHAQVPPLGIADDAPTPARIAFETTWPGARLNTGAAATWALGDVSGRDHTILAEPAESLADIAGLMPTEWRLVLEHAGGERGTEGVLGVDGMVLPPLASSPARPAMPVSALAPPRIVRGSADATLAATRLAAPPSLPQQLAQCDALSFFSRHACRVEVCKPFEGLAAECPAPRPEVLP